MALPSRMFNYYTNLNIRINWKFKEIGAIKGILGYYYKEWILLRDIDIFMISGLFHTNLSIQKHHNQMKVFSTMDLIENFFFGIGAFYKRWSYFQDKSRKELLFYIDQLSLLLTDGVFGTGIIMTPIITQFVLGGKSYLSYFLSYSKDEENFYLLIIEENNTIIPKRLNKKEMLKSKSMDYLIVELPTSAISKYHAIKRGEFYRDLQLKYSIL